ncbi:MAG: chemotaxis protein CheA, partial [Rhodocyclaceae bacterium]
VLDRLRNAEVVFSSDLAALLLDCKDHIAALIATTQGSAVEGTENGEALQHRLQAYLAAPLPLPVAEAVPEKSEPVVRVSAPVLIGSAGSSFGPAHWHISLRFSPDLLQHGMDPLSFVRYLANYGEIVHLATLPDALPGWTDYDAEACYLGFEIDLKSGAAKEEIESVFDFVRDAAQIRILPPHSKVEEFLALIEALPEGNSRLGEILVAGGSLTERELASALAAQAQQGSEASSVQRPLGEILVDARLVPPLLVKAALDKQKRGEEKRALEARSIKIPADRLDHLINLVGEMVIAGASSQLLAQRAGNPELLESAGNLLRRVEDIRDTALRLRMVPIGEVFSRFPRIVRDVTRDLGKEIELKISGADAELDKSMVERLGDPLMHMVRNAIDHGIEPAALRSARGKPAQGMLQLNAYHESGSIVIEVADDGGGLDCDRILGKAVERGLVSPSQNLSRQEIFHLIFSPGFSTAEQVTNLSGRGVGMDVVKRNIEALRGRVEIDSEPGQGTRMRICLPLTLAIIDGYEVQVGPAHFILPLDTVLECVDLPAAPRADYLNLRGEVLPFVRLGEIFEIAAIASAQSVRQSIVVVRFDGRKAGIVVDRLLGDCQAVIKPLGRLFEKLRGISGSTILGSGEVALILDVPQLIDAAASFESRQLSVFSAA